jgi:hypothetical protein
MMRLVTLLLVLVCTTSCSLSEESLEFESAMRSISTEYAALHKAFCADSTVGVDEAAQKIEELARAVDSSTIAGKNVQRLKALPERLVSSASKLASAKDLAAKRIVFKELSETMVEWAQAAKPTGVHVASCAVAKARWLQHEDKVFNPYFGSSKLHCGEIEDRRSQPKDDGHKGHAGSAGSHSDH